MPLKSLRVKIATPAEILPRGRGFYQLEEESLYLPLEYGPTRERFFSFLESENIFMQLDRSGRLLFVEITLPRRRWKIKKNLVAPETALSADIRFLDFRQPFAAPEFVTDPRRQHLLIRFGRGPAVHNYFLAENLIAQADNRDFLVAIWVSDIVDDLAGREIAAWRCAIAAGITSPSSLG